MRHVRPLVGLLAVLVMAGFVPIAPAVAQSGGSSLDAYSLDGHLLIERSQRETNRLAALPCSAIHRAISIYNEDEPWEVDPTYDVWASRINTTDSEFESLSRYFGSELYQDRHPPEDRITFDYDEFARSFCTEIHIDGWQPATANVLGWVDGGSIWVTVTQVGPLTCTDPGQVLMVQSGFYYFIDHWEWYFGTGWIEDFDGGEPSVTGSLLTECMEIVPGGAADFASVAELVPTAQINVNPGLQGLTGLSTWLWYDFSAPDSYLLQQSITISARGTTWALNMNAWVDQVSWDIDCESGCDYRGIAVGFDQSGLDYTLDLPDSFDLVSEPAVLAPATVYDGGAPSDRDAAAAHLYRTKGDYTLSTATTWRGYYDLFGVIYPYDPVVVAEAAPYQVIEIRSRLVTPDT